MAREVSFGPGLPCALAGVVNAGNLLAAVPTALAWPGMSRPDSVTRSRAGADRSRAAAVPAVEALASRWGVRRARLGQIEKPHV
jgi:hypothetical protein